MSQIDEFGGNLDGDESSYKSDDGSNEDVSDAEGVASDEDQNANDEAEDVSDAEGSDSEIIITRIK